MSLPDGITIRVIETPSASVSVLERDHDDPGTPADRVLVLVHGEIDSDPTWRETIEALPSDLRVIGVALSDDAGATTQLRDVAALDEPLASVLTTLGVTSAHALGWASAAPDFAHPADFRRAILEGIGYVGPRHDPAPPTEAIIIRSSD